MNCPTRSNDENEKIGTTRVTTRPIRRHPRGAPPVAAAPLDPPDCLTMALTYDYYGRSAKCVRNPSLAASRHSITSTTIS